MISKNSLDNKMRDLVSFKNENEKQKFDAVILHLETMNKIQGLIDKNKKNRQWLADQLNVDKSFVSQLFAGDKLLNFKLLANINKIFNTKIQISFTSESNYQIDAVASVIDLSNIRPELLPDYKYLSSQPSKGPVAIPMDEPYDIEINSTLVP